MPHQRQEHDQDHRRFSAWYRRVSLAPPTAFHVDLVVAQLRCDVESGVLAD